MLPTKFRFIWSSGFRGEIFLKWANQKQELPVVAMFVNGSGQNGHLYRRPSIDASYQVSVHLAEGVSEEKIKMWKVNGWQTTDAKWWQKLTLTLARWAKKGKTAYFCEKFSLLRRHLWLLFDSDLITVLHCEYQDHMVFYKMIQNFSLSQPFFTV